MTVSSNSNYKPCWNCNADVNKHGGGFCEEFDAYHCNKCDTILIHCPICVSEGIETTHTYHPIYSSVFVKNDEENDFSQNPERQVGRFLTDEEKEQMRLEDEERHVDEENIL